MKRPQLNAIPLLDAIEDIGSRPAAVITLSVGQWDALLATTYDQGWTLLEVDDAEQPVAAYRKEVS